MRLRVDKRLYVIVAIITVALIGVLVAATLCIINMRAAINKQVYSNLADVADQTDSAIEKRVELYVDLLNNLRNELEDMEEAGGDVTVDIVKLQDAADANGLLRVAFCDENGIAYGSDDVLNGTDLSEREFYKRGMQGLSTITEELTDRMGTGEKINIITTPWYREDGTIRGVFGITFYSERMSDLLHVDAFDGNGGSFAVNESGIIVIDSRASTANGGNSYTGEHLVNNGAEEGAPDYEEGILDSDERNADKIADIKEALLAGSNGNTSSEADYIDSDKYSVYIDGVKYLYYQQTLTFDCLGGDVQWHIFTIVSNSYVRSRFRAINFDFYTLIGIFLIIFMISTIAVLILAKRQRAAVEKIAYVDSITGGDNYPMYIRKLRGAGIRKGSFVSMDLMDFNSLCVAVGAEKSDRVLRAVQESIKKMLGPNDLIAHVSRDNFALFLQENDPPKVKDKIGVYAGRLFDLSHELNVPHLKIRCGVYITDYFTSDDIDSCFNRAGQAREMARKRGRPYWKYEESDNAQMLLERRLSDYFEEALEKKEFEVWYQPKFSVKTGKIVGAEALVRWRRNGELISPGKFIPLFESNGMISRLDEYMFREVCRRQKLRSAAGKRVEPVSVNLSRATMYNEHITEKYMGILKLYGVDVKQVQIEITESAVIGKDDLTELLKEFRGMGEHILLDDFGTGYSSLSMLSSKCFDTLKIDKSLVDDIGTETGVTLISNIIHMAHELEMSVTAEGVEEKSQCEQLRTLDCDAIQGFYFSRPLPMAEYETLLDKGA